MAMKDILQVNCHRVNLFLLHFCLFTESTEVLMPLSWLSSQLTRSWGSPQSFPAGVIKTRGEKKNPLVQENASLRFRRRKTKWKQPGQSRDQSSPGWPVLALGCDMQFFHDTLRLLL